MQKPDGRWKDMPTVRLERRVAHRRTLPLHVLLVVFVAALGGTACRSTDTTTQVCGQLNRECHQACGAHSNDSADFGQSKTATQWISQCDVRCEKNFQACLLRQRDKNLRGINE